MEGRDEAGYSRGALSAGDCQAIRDASIVYDEAVAEVCPRRAVQAMNEFGFAIRRRDRSAILLWHRRGRRGAKCLPFPDVRTGIPRGVRHLRLRDPSVTRHRSRTRSSTRLHLRARARP